MPSYDITCKSNEVEVGNALAQTKKEIATRFDFKNTAAAVEKEGKNVFLLADNNFQMKQVIEVLAAKLSKRSVDLRFFEYSDEKSVSGGKVRVDVTIKEGIDSDYAKKIIKVLKESKIKVQGSIQGDSVRVSGTKKDDLQKSMQLIKESLNDLPLEFGNFRN